MKKRIALYILILLVTIFSLGFDSNVQVNAFDNISVNIPYNVTNEDNELPEIGDEILYNGESYIIVEFYFGASGYHEYCKLVDFNNKYYLVKMPIINSFETLTFIYCFNDLSFDPWQSSISHQYINNPKVITYTFIQEYRQYTIDYYYYISCKEVFFLKNHILETGVVTNHNVSYSTDFIFGYDLYLNSSYYYESTQNNIYTTFTESEFKNGFYYSNLKNNFGLNVYGSCGFIALQMILSYYDSLYDDNIISEQYDLSIIQSNYLLEDFTESPGSSESFHSYLINMYLSEDEILQKDFGLLFDEFDDLFSAYKNSRTNNALNGYTSTYQCLDYNTSLNSIEESIINELDQGKPVILMSNAWELYHYTRNNSTNDYISITKNEKWYGYGHAVVVYGYYLIDGNVYLRTNMGWKGTNYNDVLIRTVGLTGYLSIGNEENSQNYKDVSNYFYLENGVSTEINFQQILNLTEMNLNQNIHFFKFINNTSSHKNTSLYKIIVDSASTYCIYINGKLINNSTVISLTKKEYQFNLDYGIYFNLTIVSQTQNILSGILSIDSGERSLLFSSSNLTYYVYNAATDEYIIDRLSVLFINPVIDEITKTIHFDGIRIQCELQEGQIGYNTTDFGVIFICGEEYDSIETGYYLFVFNEYSIQYVNMPNINGFVGVIEDIEIEFSDEEFDLVTFEQLNYIF